MELASVKKNSLKQHIKDLTLCSDDLYDTVYDLENHVNDLNQYSRRENIELQHIPESVEQKDLEKFVLNLLKSINIDIASYDLVAVHRLGQRSPQKTRTVIVRFVNRKSAYLCLYNAKFLNKSLNLTYKKIFITENLCPTNKKLFNRLYKLKKEKRLHNVWSYQGHVFFKFNDSRDERPLQIKHQEDIDFYFERKSTP